MFRNFNLQINLRWLAYFVLVLALALGWYRDHDRAQQQLTKIPGEIAVTNVQLANVSMRLVDCVVGKVFKERTPEGYFLTGYPSINPNQPFPSSPKAFCDQVDQAIARAEQGKHPWGMRAFRMVGYQLLNAPDDQFDQAFLPFMRHGNHPEPWIRQETLNIVGGALRKKPERVEPFYPELIKMLTTRLSDAEPMTRGMAIECLHEIGPPAAPALEALQKIAADFQEPYRARATLAIAAIDESLVSREQLKDCVRRRDDQWELVAWHLIETGTEKEVKAFFVEQFQLSGPEEGIIFAEMLNDVKIESIRKEEEAIRREN